MKTITINVYDKPDSAVAVVTQGDQTTETYNGRCPAEALGHAMLELSTSVDLEIGVKLDITLRGDYDDEDNL